MVEIFIIIVLVLLSAAVLGIEVSRKSTLILRVKQGLLLCQPYSKSLLALSKFNTWWSLIPRWFVILLPIILLIVILLRLHHFLSELLDCEYCTSFHTSWLLLYFLVGLQLVWALCLAPIGLFFVSIINKIEG